jgi:hypothetical protein
MMTPENYTDLTNKIDNLSDSMKSLIELNQSLLKQNIKLSNQVYGKLQIPEDNSGSVKKELFYKEYGENIYIIHGPGTYDNKEQIKSLCEGAEWMKEEKGWRVMCELSTITDKFPDISVKPS